MIGRREFITMLGGAAAAWPLAAGAQRGDRLRRIGVLVAFAEDEAVPHNGGGLVRAGELVRP